MAKMWVLPLLVQFFFSSAFAQNLMTLAEEQYFAPELFERVGNEIELADITVNQVAEILQTELDGKIQKNSKREKIYDELTGHNQTFLVVGKELVNSSIGTVDIKREENGTSNEGLRTNTASTPIVEIVADPLTHDKTEILQTALDKLEAAGARGTDAGFAISIQVNVEIADGDPLSISPTHIIDIWRNYFKKPHREQIIEAFKTPENRQKYLGYYTDGMMERIFDDSYRANLTWKSLSFDFMYRQSLELLGYKDAWTMSEHDARSQLKHELTTRGFEIILPVMKWNFIRASSLFMFVTPEDWLTKFLEETTWFHKHPILEFREPNSDFQLQRRNRQILGLIQETRRRGEFLNIDFLGNQRAFIAGSLQNKTCKDLFVRY
jgi:hypothetical protein